MQSGEREECHDATDVAADDCPHIPPLSHPSLRVKLLCAVPYFPFVEIGWPRAYWTLIPVNLVESLGPRGPPHCHVAPIGRPRLARFWFWLAIPTV